MFSTLLESKRKRDKTFGETAASVVLHAVLIGLAVYGTLHAADKLDDKIKQEDLKFAVLKPPPPPPPEPEKPPPPDVVAAPPPPKGFQVLTAPINIPDKIPDVDLSKAVTNESDFSGKGVAGGRANGVEGGTPTNSDQPLFEFQVEKPVLPKDGNPPPKYPSMLESSRVEGEVLAQFVVDTLGKADMSTFKALQSTNDLFVGSVRNVLPQWKFYPAEAGGRKVKQIVQLPLKFTVPK
ncbi:MAG TPA: energy transducer TonB [Gemmatimonadaceae bacterium]|nr:energy transducer TonB [Gemmatimonadaceae bacterium]